MSQPQIPIYHWPAKRGDRAKPYILAGALGLVAGVLSVAFLVLRRH